MLTPYLTQIRGLAWPTCESEVSRYDLHRESASRTDCCVSVALQVCVGSLPWTEGLCYDMQPLEWCWSTSPAPSSFPPTLSLTYLCPQCCIRTVLDLFLDCFVRHTLHSVCLGMPSSPGHWGCITPWVQQLCHAQGRRQHFPSAVPHPSGCLQ